MLHVVRLLRLRYIVEKFEIPIQILVYRQDRGDITTAIAVIRCTPHGYEILLGEVILVSLHNQLVRTAYQF